VSPKTDDDTGDLQRQESIRHHYGEDYYRPLLESYRSKDRFTRYRLEKVFEIYKPKGDEKVLDLGCGVGTFSLELAREGIEITGLDYSEESINICRRLAEDLDLEAEFVLADATSTGFAPASFDVVICADLVEHLYLEVFKRLIGEVKRVLKVGGKLIIWTPNPGHIFEYLKQRNMILKRDEGHVGYRTMRKLKEELTGQGFKIEKAYYRESHLPVFNVAERLLQWLVPFLRRRNAILAVRS